MRRLGSYCPRGEGGHHAVARGAERCVGSALVPGEARLAVGSKAARRNVSNSALVLAGVRLCLLANTTRPRFAYHEPQREPLPGGAMATGWCAAERFRRVKGCEDLRSAPRSSAVSTRRSLTEGYEAQKSLGPPSTFHQGRGVRGDRGCVSTGLGGCPQNSKGSGGCEATRKPCGKAHGSVQRTTLDG